MNVSIANHSKTSIDVIVPCYAYGRFLRQCVESVLIESDVRIRVLIIDDASPDNSHEVAEELVRTDDRIAFVRHATNRGHIETYNEGIDWASAKYTVLLSADDYLLPGALRRSACLMDSHQEVGFTHGRGVEFQDGGADDESPNVPVVGDMSGFRILTGREFIEISGARNIVCTPTAVVRTDLQKRLGGYRADLPHSGDMEMWLRFAAHASVGQLNAFQAVYRIHASNMSHAYLGRVRIPDLHQRKAAIECLFETCGQSLEGSTRLRKEMLRALGRDALGWASASFNDGALDLVEQLATFALDTSPGIRRTLPWSKLELKRRLGVRGWRLLRKALRN